MNVLREEGVHELKYKPGGRLDMSHGFLHHIRRNQIARRVPQLLLAYASAIGHSAKNIIVVISSEK